MRGAAEGFNKASENLMNISVQKKKLERENDTFKMDMKIKNLQLDKLSLDMSPERLKAAQDTLALGNKLKKAEYDFESNKLEIQRMALEEIKNRSKTYGEGYGKGAGDATENYNSQGLMVGGVEYDINKAAKGEYSPVTASQRLARNKAASSLKKNLFAQSDLPKQPLEEVKKNKLLGIFGGGEDEKTGSVAREIHTNQDLINLVQNQEALEERGVNVDKLLEYYEDELLTLARKGHLTQE